MKGDTAVCYHTVLIMYKYIRRQARALFHGVFYLSVSNTRMLRGKPARPRRGLACAIVMCGLKRNGTAVPWQNKDRVRPMISLHH